MPFKEDLEHAYCRWQAEEENARRLSVRARIIATVSFGFLGLLLFRVLEALVSGQFPRGAARIGILAPGVLGLLALVACIAWLFSLLPTLGEFRRQRGRRSAGDDLQEHGRRISPSRLLMIPEDQRLGWEAILDTLESAGPEAQEDRYRESLRDLFRRQRAQAFRSAAVELLERNTEERDRLASAQAALLTGLIAIIAALAIWMYTAPPDEGATAPTTSEVERSTRSRQ